MCGRVASHAEEKAHGIGGNHRRGGARPAGSDSLSEKDADTQIWNLEKVENELHKEPPDHVLEAIAELVSAEQSVWTGTPSALADAVHVGMAANALSKYLNVKSGRLLDEYRVRYENKVRHEGRRITLTYDAESK